MHGSIDEHDDGSRRGSRWVSCWDYVVVKVAAVVVDAVVLVDVLLLLVLLLLL